jgi:hypothetical protein
MGYETGSLPVLPSTVCYTVNSVLLKGRGINWLVFHPEMPPGQKTPYKGTAPGGRPSGSRIRPYEGGHGLFYTCYAA